MLCNCLVCFFALLINPVKSIENFYKLAGKNDDASVADANIPFLTQSFFTCGSYEDCTKMAKIKGSSGFKEVIGQQKVQENGVVYEKITALKTKDPTWSDWTTGKCNAMCGEGNRFLVRYCYSHLPCKGKSSQVESCNVGDCPELHKCIYNRTGVASVFLGVSNLTISRSWLPLLDLKPSCNNTGKNFIMTSTSLEVFAGDMWYHYSCCAFKNPICSVMVNSTSWEYNSEGLTHAIEKHPIDCGIFAYISSFQLERNSTSMRYSYTCCQVFDQKWKDLMQCTTNLTELVPHLGYYTFALRGLPVTCNAGFGLSRLKLHRNEAMRQWGFEFRCCKVGN